MAEGGNVGGEGTDRIVDLAAFIGQRRMSAFNYQLIVLSCLITVFDGFDMMMISFTAPYIQTELHLDKMMLGDVFSAGLVGMMLGGFFFAYLGDRLGRRPTIVAAALSFGILTLATALVQNYMQFLLLRFLDGFAIGGMLPLAWALNIEYAPEKMRSTVVTVIMLGYSCGSAIAGPATVAIAPKFGWQGVFAVGGIGTLLCTLLLWRYLPESVWFLASKGREPNAIAAMLNRLQPGFGATVDDIFIASDEHDGRARDFRVGQLFEGVLAWITPLLWLGYFVSTLAIYFSASWGPIILEELGFTRDVAAYASSLAALTGALAGIALMRFTDRMGPISVAFYPVIAIPVLLILGFSLVPLSLFLPAAVFAATIIAGEHYGVLSIASVFYPSGIRANGGGWATSVAKIGGIAGPMIGAAVLSSGMPIIRTYALLAVCPAILGLCAAGIAIAHRRQVAQLEPKEDPILVA